MALLNQAKGSTQAPGGGQYSYVQGDAVMRSAVHFISRVVPIIYDNGCGMVPADLYYAQVGLEGIGTSDPDWLSMNSGTNLLVAQWDATDGRSYRRLGTAGGQGSLGAQSSLNRRIIYPTGVGGLATESSPKNPTALAVLVSSRLRFPENIAYATADLGWGASCDPTAQFFLFGRSGGGHWSVYTNDGSTSSSADSTAADDDDWHEFQARWVLGATPAIEMYMDDLLIITKTTNLPTEPLPAYVAGNNTHHVDIVDYSIRWENA